MLQAPAFWARYGKRLQPVIVMSVAVMLTTGHHVFSSLEYIPLTHFIYNNGERGMADLVPNKT